MGCLQRFGDVIESWPEPCSRLASAPRRVHRWTSSRPSKEFEIDGFEQTSSATYPANRVLTAYGLMEFADMAAVYPVDPALILRTRDWLVAAQRKDGGWDPDATWLHDWSAAQGAVSTTARIAHALAEDTDGAQAQAYYAPAVRGAAARSDCG